MIVEQALGDVHELVACDAESLDLFEQPVEVPALRLVRADVFGGDDRIEGRRPAAGCWRRTKLCRCC